ncbi:MAG: hypothetical protein R3B09_21840 [Nannocystaceae bacterium]
MAPALAVLLAPAQADACSPAFCRAWTSLTIAPAAPIPSGGVLIIPAAFGEGFDEPIDTDLGALLVEVSSEQGDVINGTLELNLDPLLVVWRPDVPLAPGLYDASISADNSTFGDEGWCAEANVVHSGSFEVVDAPVPGAAAPVVTGDAELLVTNELTLESLVCCDGATPAEVDCGSPGIQWGRGFCATTLGRGNVKATFTIDPVDFEAGGGQVIYEGFAYGEATRSLTTAGVACITPKITNLATGKSNEGEEVCAGAELTDQLGPVDLDPSEVLAEQCVGEPYTCAIGGGGWDSRDCQAWPADDTTTGDTTGDTTSTSTSTSGGETTGDVTTGDGSGTSDTSATTAGENPPEVSCACRSDDPRPSGLLWLLVAAPLLRRRRRGA